MLKKTKYLIFLLCIFLSGCSQKNINVDSINNSVNNLISNLPEEDFENININKEVLDGNNVEEIKNNDVNLNNSIISEDVLPDFGKNFDFSFSYPSSNLPDKITYLDNIWDVKALPTPNISYCLNNPSLYLYTYFEYDNKDIKKESYNERFLKLINDSFNLFGTYKTGDNVNFTSIEDLDKGNIIFLWDLMDTYIIQTFSDKQNNVATASEINQNSRIECFLYFISKENIHDAYGEESSILSYIKEKIPKHQLKLFYQTDEGTFVIDENNNMKNKKAIISKYLN